MPILDVHHTEDRWGGAANVAANLASLGARVTLLCAGSYENLSSPNIEVECTGGPNTVKTRLWCDNRMLARYDENVTFREDSVMVDRFKSIYADFPYIVFCDYGRGVLTCIAPILDLTYRKGTSTIVDPKGKDWGKYENAWMIKANHQEWQEAIRRPSVRRLVVTHQGQRVFMSSREDASVAFDVPKVPVVDPTGCGDSFLAAMAYHLLQGGTVYDAVLRGIAGGSAAVQHQGTYILKPEDIK